MNTIKVAVFIMNFCTSISSPNSGEKCSKTIRKCIGHTGFQMGDVTKDLGDCVGDFLEKYKSLPICRSKCDSAAKIEVTKLVDKYDFRNGKKTPEHFNLKEELDVVKTKRNSCYKECE